jgi:hypothetical protein
LKSQKFQFQCKPNCRCRKWTTEIVSLKISVNTSPNLITSVREWTQLTIGHSYSCKDQKKYIAQSSQTPKRLMSILDYTITRWVNRFTPIFHKGMQCNIRVWKEFVNQIWRMLWQIHIQNLLCRCIRTVSKCCWKLNNLQLLEN